MINKVLKKIFGDKSAKDQKEYQPYVDQTNTFFQEYQALSNDALRSKTTELKKRIDDYLMEDHEKLDELNKQVDSDQTGVSEKENLYEQIDNLKHEIDQKLEKILLELLPEAFAVVKETARRFKENEALEVTASDNDRDLASNRKSIKIKKDLAYWSSTWLAAGTEVRWDMMHYDVQLMGGAVLHFGKIGEMQTGEGKTLVSTLPVYLNALAGKGVHLVTVNQYLAKRDAEWMGPIYEFHGMSVDCVDLYDPNTEKRRNAYGADVVYGTNNEFGFDYLRDNMSSDPDQLVQKKHHYAIIDEVDSVLIDEARTPLIISGPTPDGDKHEFETLKPKIEKLYNAQKKLVTELLAEAKEKIKKSEDENLDKKKSQKLSDEGGIALLRAHRALPKNKALIKYLSEPGIKLHLQKTENVYMAEQNKRMPEIDQELYFVIDEKNNAIELMDMGTELLADDDNSDYYTLPDIGMQIAELEKQDLPQNELLEQKDQMMRDFTVKSERIHTMNQLLKSYALFEKEVDYVIMDNKVKIVDEQTGRMMEGRRYSDGLHQAIEAKENVKVEAATQTYATVTLQNYFRMYHKLAGMTGTAETEAKELWDIYSLDVTVIPTNETVVRDDREDMIYKTAREKYTGIIDEIERLVGEGRPVLVGTTTVEISELLSRMLKLKSIQHQVLNAKYHQKEAEIVSEAGKAGTVTIATNMAGRGTDIKLGEGVVEAGGLAIIGTERHDSRRVDRQLRGRAGRQGDPGSSQFYVSLEDNLMRLFGSERIAKLMDRMGLKEGEVIQHKMISRSIERAQKKVEENNFGIRKKLLEYDDVMNAQRKAIYKKRKHALFGERLETDIDNVFNDTADSIVNINHSHKDFENFQLDLLRDFSIDSPVSEKEFFGDNVSEIVDKVANKSKEHYETKMKQLSQKAYPVIKQVYENESGKYKNMVFPITDGNKSMEVIVNLEKSYKEEGATLKLAIEKNITLGLIDNQWKEHLREMDDLRQSVQQAVYEQKDPLLVYKLESYELFKKMLDHMNREIVSYLTKADLPLQVEEEKTIKSTNQSEKNVRDSYSNAEVNNSGDIPEFAGSEGHNEAQANSGQATQQKKKPIERKEEKVGRNEPCPCGSGKKYKQCHGK